MSDTKGQPAQPHQVEDTKRRRRQIGRFVSVFAAVAFALMFSYYGPLRNTLANDWYMFQVARSTAAVLSQIGHSCSIAQPYAGREPEIRAVLGVNTAKETPLTPWESWRYQAITYRHSLTGARQHIRDIQRETPSPEREQRLADADAKLAQLEARELGPLVSFVWKPSAPEAGPKPERPWAFSFVLVPDCGAIPSVAILWAAIIAFPASWRKRLLGMAGGAMLLYVVNTLRLVALALIGAWDNGGEIFRFCHEYVWQSIYIIFVIVVWLGWVELVVRRRPS